MTKYFLILWSLVQFVFDLPAAETDASTKRGKNVQVLLELIELSAIQYNALTFGDAALLNDHALRSRLETYISNQQAEVLEVSLLSCSQGHSGEVISATQKIFPTEYELPVIIPTQVNGSGTRTLEKAAGYSATAFEQRSVGTFLEIKPRVDTMCNSIVELLLKKSRFQYFKSWASWRDQYGERNALLPIFALLSTNQSILLGDLKYRHIATITPMKNENQRDHSKRQMIFVRSKLTL